MPSMLDNTFVLNKLCYDIIGKGKIKIQLSKKYKLLKRKKIPNGMCAL